MTVSTARRLHASKTVRDIEPGDFVRRVGHRGVAFVESVGLDGYVWIAWKNGRKEILPLGMLRRARSGGHELDARKS